MRLQLTIFLTGYGPAVLQSLEFDKEPSVMGGSIGITAVWFIAFAVQSLLALHYYPKIRQSKLFRKMISPEAAH